MSKVSALEQHSPDVLLLDARVSATMQCCLGLSWLLFAAVILWLRLSWLQQALLILAASAVVLWECYCMRRNTVCQLRHDDAGWWLLQQDVIKSVQVQIVLCTSAVVVLRVKLPKGRRLQLYFLPDNCDEATRRRVCRLLRQTAHASMH